MTGLVFLISNESSVMVGLQLMFGRKDESTSPYPQGLWGVMNNVSTPISLRRSMSYFRIFLEVPAGLGANAGIGRLNDVCAAQATPQ